MRILFITSEKNIQGGENSIHLSLVNLFKNSSKNDQVVCANFENYRTFMGSGPSSHFSPQAIYIDFSNQGDLQTAKKVIADVTQSPPIRTIFAINCTPEQEEKARKRSIIVAQHSDHQRVLETLQRINIF